MFLQLLHVSVKTCILLVECWAIMWAFLVTHTGKNLPAIQVTQVQALGQENMLLDHAC